MFSQRFLRILPLLIMLLTLGLSACGEDKDKDNTEDQATTQPTTAANPDTPATTQFVIADIDADSPAEKIEELQPLADYLAAQLSDYGVSQGVVKIAPDLATIVQWLEAGEIDLFYDSLYPAMIVSDQTGAIPLVRGWRGGEPIYHTVFFARANSGLTALEDVQGKLIAFDDNNSTSGYMVPVAYMLTNGLKPVEKDSPDATVAEDEIGYVFSGDDENTIEWVLTGRVAVGVTDNLTYAEDITVETQEQLVILAETQSVPRRVIMVRSTLDPTLVEALKTVLMEMDADADAAPLLDELNTKEFDEFPEGATTAFDEFREIYTIFETRPQ